MNLKILWSTIGVLCFILIFYFFVYEKKDEIRQSFQENEEKVEQNKKETQLKDFNSVFVKPFNQSTYEETKIEEEIKKNDKKLEERFQKLDKLLEKENIKNNEEVITKEQIEIFNQKVQQLQNDYDETIKP